MKRDFKSITVGWGGFLIYILNNSKWYILSVSAFLLFTLYYHPYISEIQSLTTGLTHQYLVTYNMWHMSIGIQQKQIDQQHAKKPYVFFLFFFTFLVMYLFMTIEEYFLNLLLFLRTGFIYRRCILYYDFYIDFIICILLYYIDLLYYLKFYILTRRYIVDHMPEKSSSFC